MILFLDSQVWAHSVDPDQTFSEGAVQSGSTLSVLSVSFQCITLFQLKGKKHFHNFV